MKDIGNPELERVPSGVPGIDTILGGGFFKGGLYIIQGTPGTGKTTLGNQICFNHVADGSRALYITLLAEYHARMLQHLSAMSFFDASKIPDQLSYISGFSILRQDGLPGLLGLVRREILARDVSVLILDGFATAQRTARDDQALNEFVHELQGVAIATDCTMFLLNSAKNSDNVTPEHTMVDGIIELSDRLFGWSAERALQVVKFRGGSYLRGRHAFDITEEGLIAYPRIESLLAKPSRPTTAAMRRRRAARRHAAWRPAGRVDDDGDGTVRRGQDDPWIALPVPLQRRRARPAVRLLRDAAAYRGQGARGLPPAAAAAR